jgi:hypothetical protein
VRKVAMSAPSGKRAGRPRMPKGPEAVSGIQRKYVAQVRPRLTKAEQWRQKSRQASWVASVR